MDILSLIYMIVGLVLITVLPVATKYGVDALKAWSEEKIADIDNALAEKYLTEITEIVSQAVMCTTQTYVTTLKEQGQFNSKAQEIAFNTTKEAVLKLLTFEAKEFIAEAYGDLDLWLDTKIEQTVLMLK